MFKFKVDDNVLFRGRIGSIKELKSMDAVFTSYNLYRVEFADGEPNEWINEMYLSKIKI